MLKIDSREPKKIFNLAQKHNIDYIKSALPVGDFVDDDLSLCIERKEIGDFVSSIKTHHLQEQLIRAYNLKYKYRFLIIVGDIKSLFFKKIKWTVNQHCGALASISVKYGTQVLMVNNNSQLILLVEKIINKIKNNDGAVTFNPTVALKTLSQEMKILISIESISLKTAKEILNKFSFKEIISGKINWDEVYKNKIIKINKIQKEKLKIFGHSG